MKKNNSFLIFFKKIYLKNITLLYPHYLTIYQAKTQLIKKKRHIASYWEIYYQLLWVVLLVKKCMSKNRAYINIKYDF